MYQKNIPIYDQAAPDTRFAFVAGPSRVFTSHSTLVRRALVEQKELNVGAVVSPRYDTEETISSGAPCIFTDPNLGTLERFERLKAEGLDAIEAMRQAGMTEGSTGAAGSPSESSVADSGDGAAAAAPSGDPQ